MRVIRRIKKLFGLPDWDGYVKDMNEFYERERKIGATEEEIQCFIGKDKNFVEKFGGRKYADKLQ